MPGPAPTQFTGSASIQLTGVVSILTGVVSILAGVVSILTGVASILTGVVSIQFSGLASTRFTVLDANPLSSVQPAPEAPPVTPAILQA